jgi:phosphatidylglycerol:prolipoprotein diacylglycerol transferase
MVAGSLAALLTLHVRGALTLRAVPAIALAAVGLSAGARLQYRLETMPLDAALRMSFPDVQDAGIRLPLGMVVGGLVAAAWCVVARLSWRDLGDALAVGAMVMVPFGRLGCWMNACCLGGVCPAWLPICVRFPPGTEAHGAQVGQGLLEVSAAASLPAHPLPFYFAGVAILIFLVLVRMIRRGAASGMPLAVACILGSAGKLALETLRATPRPMGPTFVVPAVVLVGTLVLLAAARLRPAPVVGPETAGGTR